MENIQSKYDEYKEVLATYRENIKTLNQLITFLTTVNVGIIGISLERGKYELLILAAFILFILLRSAYRQVHIMMPVILRGLILENQFGEQGLLHYKINELITDEKFMSILNQHNFYDLSQEKETLGPINKILKQLKFAFFQYNLPFNISRLVLVLIAIIMLAQFATGVVFLLK